MVGEAHLRYRYKKNDAGKFIKSATIYTAAEHKINQADVDPQAAYICEKLNNEGFETYIVGGAVRDLLLKKVPKDFDIASAAPPSKIKRFFGNSRIIGKRFRLVHIFFGEKIFEIATFRSLGNGADGNTFGTIDDDVKRRDFTMNALFYDPQKQLVLDYVGGFEDINDRKIKPIIPLKTIFEDDPVRMIRAVKYAVLSDFKLPFFLREKIKNSSSFLKRISDSRLTEEIAKILKSPQAGKIIEALASMGLYVHLQPRASKLIAESAPFRTRYFTTLSKLNRHDSAEHDEYTESLSGGLGALVRDYIDDSICWKETTEESYRETFRLARKFVLPINPPRMELGRAIRDIYAEHGITVKKWRNFDRR
ncbi:MAG: polynucleotide adenylyltransferase PcnB [Spirochaetaceae bacterium]|jgi:poly(A) polymerase|nr:polynucleotide adenylyltransferase PcnB [Spirochaetaceae bacterium]